MMIYFQPEFVSAMFDVAGNINGLNLNDTEIGLLSAVILATPGESCWEPAPWELTLACPYTGNYLVFCDHAFSKKSCSC